MSKGLKRWGIWGGLMVLCLGGPVLVMSLCSGWNEGSMAVQSCRPDWPVLHDLANTFYAFILVAAFMAGIPLLLYIVICMIVAFVVARILVR